MAKASFGRRARATIFTATAGLSLTVALLPGAANAAPGEPASDSSPLIPSQQSLARGDARLTQAEKRPGVRQLRERLGVQGVLELDPATGTARQVARLDGYLTAASPADPEDIARQYLRAHPDVFGLSADQVRGLTLRKRYTDVAGIRHLSFVQSVDGVPVFGNGVKANVARDGRLISVLGSPVRGLPSTLAPARITATQAQRLAVRDIAAARTSAAAARTPPSRSCSRRRAARPDARGGRSPHRTARACGCTSSTRSPSGSSTGRTCPPT